MCAYIACDMFVLMIDYYKIPELYVLFILSYNLRLVNYFRYSDAVFPISSIFYFRDLFKKIKDTKGTFYAKMVLIKDRNGIELTEVEGIKKRWQGYTEELYKKDLNDPDNNGGVTAHLEPDILECEVKWALGSITMNKASGGDGIPVELLQILKDLLDSCIKYAKKFEKLSSGHRT